MLSVAGDASSPGVKQFYDYSSKYGGPAFPTVVLLTPQGRIINVYLGFDRTRIWGDFAARRSYEPRCMVDRLMTVAEGLKVGKDLTKTLVDGSRPPWDRWTPGMRRQPAAN